MGHGASYASYGIYGIYGTVGTVGTAVITSRAGTVVPAPACTSLFLYLLHVPVPQYIQHTTSLYGTRPSESSPTVWGECRGSEDLKILGTSA